MKNTKILTLGCLLVLCALVLLGCSTNTTQLDRMSVMELRAIALKYKKAIVTKKERINEIIRLQFGDDLPYSHPFTSEMAAKIVTDEELGELFDSLFFEDTLQLGKYVEKIREKGGDTSDLEIDSIFQEEWERKMILPPIYLPPIPKEELPPELKTRELEIS